MIISTKKAVKLINAGDAKTETPVTKDGVTYMALTVYSTQKTVHVKISLKEGWEMDSDGELHHDERNYPMSGGCWINGNQVSGTCICPYRYKFANALKI